MKKLLFTLVLSLMFIGGVSAKDKVKVYIFEAGGCPYCEAEVEYLEGLDSYNEKFEIVRKELYVDHIDWEEGEDYELGKKVAEAFLNKGYENASYQGTPFVVISNIYAAASYSESLESVIDEAYEKGDKDIVECFNNDEDGCEEQISSYKEIKTTSSKETTEKENNNTLTVIICIAVVIVVIASLVVMKKKVA